MHVLDKILDQKKCFYLFAIVDLCVELFIRFEEQFLCRCYGNSKQ